MRTGFGCPVGCMRQIRGSVCLERPLRLRPGVALDELLVCETLVLRRDSGYAREEDLLADLALDCGLCNAFGDLNGTLA